MKTIIHIDHEALFEKLGRNGEHWTKEVWQAPGGRMCLHQAIKLCCPQPGDFHIVQEVALREGWGTNWNDADETTWPDIAAKINGGIGITDASLEETFGPQWEHVVALTRRAATLTGAELNDLATARADAGYAARHAAWEAAGEAVRAAVREAAGNAAGSVVWEAAWDVEWDAVREAAWVAARSAAWALSIRDLIGQHGFTQEHYDTLTAPVRRTIGKIHPDDEDLS